LFGDYDELDIKILKFFYDRWFENYVSGLTVDEVAQKFDSEQPNEVKIRLQKLKVNMLIMNKHESLNKYDIFGFDHLFKNEPEYCMSVNADIKKILKCIDELYIQDVDKRVTHEDIKPIISNDETMYLLAIMTYLENCQFVKLDMALGGNFWVRLTYSGHFFVSKNN